MSDRHIHLNLFVPTTGHHEASWRYTETHPERITQLSYYQEIAQIAERGKLDSLFLADVPAIGRHVAHVPGGRPEPLTLLSALATVTEHIGLIGTATTTYSEPYNLARQFSSLDHLSNGRAGWNIVTSWAAGASHNFGRDERPTHTERYERATEFLEVATRLWDSWEDDAVLADRDTGVFADEDKVHRIDHEGKYFKVRGPLNIPRAPQGYPVLVQAGSSSEGRAFAARYAEAIFTAQQDLGEAQEFYADVKRQASDLGRRPSQIKVLPGLSPFIGSTEEEAKRKEQELNELSIPEVGLQHLSARFDGVDLTHLDLDKPIPLSALPHPGEVQGAQSRARVIWNVLEREPELTLRELLYRLAGARGHQVFAGTPEQIVDFIQTWVDGKAADGFNIMPPYLPGVLADFVDQVVPELQRRGIFRTEYTGTTLRDHYGLNRPANQHLQPAAV